MKNFSTDGFVTTVNGRIITDWGDTDPPFTDAPIDPRSVLKRGLGGGAVRADRKNPGRTVTLNLMPGSPDSAYVQGLFNSNANITITRAQIGTLDSAVGTEGVIVNDGQVGRAGNRPTDDQFMIELNSWTALKGGT